MNWYRYASYCLVAAIASSAATVITAAPPSTATAPAVEVRHLTLHPSPIRQPALRYALLPDATDLTPGNAAPLYLMACSHNLLAAADTAEFKADEEARYNSKKGPDAFDPERIRRQVGRFGAALHQLELAARREECHWDLPMRTEGFGTLLPHLSDLRLLADVLSLQARLQIAEGKFDDAAHTLQTGFALARHLNQNAFAIQALVGAAVAAKMTDQVRAWVASRGSPNLYWPLTDLPSPFVDLRGAMRQEHAGIYYAIPHLKEAAAGKLTAEHYAEVISRLLEASALAGRPERPDQPTPSLDQLSFSASILVAAKAELPAMGYGRAAVDAMTPSEAAGLWLAQSYEASRQELSKAVAVPFPQGEDLMARAEEQLRASRRNPLVGLQTTVRKMRFVTTRVDRQVGELRSLELIRGYAAAHEGRAPNALAGWPEAPVPIDPMTGTPFAYSIQKTHVTLDMPAPPGGLPKDSWRDEIELK